MRNFS